MSQIVFFSLFDRFTAYYNCKSWDVRKLITPRLKYTGITNRVLSWFDRFTASYKCRSWNIRKLITPRVPGTSITNRVLSLIDRFTAYYNCMSWNLRKLITLQVMHKYHKSYSKLIGLFDGLLQLYELNYQKITNSLSSVHKYRKSCS